MLLNIEFNTVGVVNLVLHSINSQVKIFGLIYSEVERVSCRLDSI